MPSPLNESTALPRLLPGGLILRQATPADAEALSEFNSRVHSDDGMDQPDARIGKWTQDLLARPHPTFQPCDFTIVEDDGKIVSSLNLISQTWTYAGIPFGVGRPELVGTLPEYRNRGLVRHQFELIHAWSAARGEIMQAITGIPYYYRIFGYEMALNLSGGRIGFSPHVPALPPDTAEPFTLRPVRPGAEAAADLAFIQSVYEQSCRRYPLACVWNAELFQYEFTGKSQGNVNRWELRIIETAGGERVGFLAHPAENWGPTQVCTRYELVPGVSWAAVTPSVIRYLAAAGKQHPAEAGKEPWDAFGLWLGEAHPAYAVVADRLPRIRPPYAWYIRIPDLPGFLTHIRPALEARLAASALAGHTGELTLSFYRSGLRLVFENGALTSIAPWQPQPVAHSGDAVFPGLTFLQLLCGYRSLAELKYAFPDVSTRGDAAPALLDVLFPRQPSDIWPVS